MHYPKPFFVKARSVQFSPYVCDSLAGSWVRFDLVGQAFAHLGPARDLLEFLVEGLVPARPIDVRVNVGKEKCEEELQISVQRVLPRAVEILGRVRMAMEQTITSHVPAAKHCVGCL